MIASSHYDELLERPGVLAVFAATARGEGLASSSQEADVARAVLSAAVRAAGSLGERGFGSPVELHVYGRDENLAWFLVLDEDERSYEMFGVTLRGDVDPEAVIAQVREERS
ncbi:MAG: hypothetical protein ACREM2_11345 [Vulcanimicrobiaceae bacterium]